MNTAMVDMGVMVMVIAIIITDTDTTDGAVKINGLILPDTWPSPAQDSNNANEFKFDFYYFF